MSSDIFELVRREEIPRRRRGPGRTTNPVYDELFHRAVSAPAGFGVKHTTTSVAAAKLAGEAIRRRSKKSGIPLRTMVRDTVVWAERADR